MSSKIKHELNPIQLRIIRQSKKLNAKDRLDYLKLMNKALRTMPASMRQKEIIKQINVYRIKAKAKPLTI